MYSPNNVEMTKSRMVGWEEHLACTKWDINRSNDLVYHEGKRRIG
jgi:hypothetical protein